MSRNLVVRVPGVEVIGPRARVAGVVLCLAVVMDGMFRPGPPPEVFVHSDKGAHVGAFLALAVAGRLALHRWPARLFWPLMLTMAPLLEWLQGVTRPLRWFSLGDVTANVAGVLLAMLLWGLWLSVAGARLARVAQKDVAE